MTASPSTARASRSTWGLGTDSVYYPANTVHRSRTRDLTVGAAPTRRSARRDLLLRRNRRRPGPDRGHGRDPEVRQRRCRPSRPPWRTRRRTPRLGRRRQPTTTDRPRRVRAEASTPICRRRSCAATSSSRPRRTLVRASTTTWATGTSVSPLRATSARRSWPPRTGRCGSCSATCCPPARAATCSSRSTPPSWARA